VRFDDERSAKAEEDRKLQHYGMYDSRANLDVPRPGVGDQLYPCPCGKFLTMGGDPCPKCVGGK